MNLQDVKSLSITEGDVRTIHNSVGNQLWGKVSYDTKYGGDTTQQTYSGKNLVDYVTNKTADGGGITISVGSDGIFTVTGVPTVNYKKIVNNFSINSILEDGTTYTVSKTEDTNLMMPQVALYNKNTGTSTYINVLNTTSESFVVDKTTYDYQFSAQTYTTSAWGEESRTVKMGFMLEKSATATAFEPYVGGIPSPNPDYPQNVNVVTGTQTLTITDGVISDNYTLNLGSTELCKIGTYQDYIYKTGDDWYIHKEIDKYIFDGQENWVTEPYGTNSWSITNLIPIYDFDASEIETMCDFAKGVSLNNRSQGDSTHTCVCYTNSSNTFVVRNTYLTSQASVQTATIGKNLYYKATPTDTKITDNTLITQLESVNEWATRYGYNVTISGNLPLILTQTALT